MYKEYCCRPIGLDRRRHRWSLLREFVESHYCVVAFSLLLLHLFVFVSSVFCSSRKFLHIFSFEIHPAAMRLTVCVPLARVPVSLCVCNVSESSPSQSLNVSKLCRVCAQKCMRIPLICISSIAVWIIMQALFQLISFIVTFICIRRAARISVANVFAIGTAGLRCSTRTKKKD